MDSVDFPAGFDKHGVAEKRVALRNHNQSIQNIGIEAEYYYEIDGRRINITQQSSAINGTVLINCTTGCSSGVQESSYQMFLNDDRRYLQVREQGEITRETNRENELSPTALHNQTASSEIARSLPTENASRVDVFEENETIHFRYVYNNSTVVVQDTGLIEALEDNGDVLNIRVYIRPHSGLTVSQPRWTYSVEKSIPMDHFLQENDWGEYGDGDTASSGCGTNDGDPSYNEDNDRDNDGICDES